MIGHARTARRASLVFAGLLASLACAGPAAAQMDLRDAARRVDAQWRAAGATIVHGAPRFLNEDETISIVIPPAAPSACTSVILVGARGISFHAKIAGAPEPSSDDAASRTQSVAGALAVVRCGGTAIRRLVVKSDAGRGAIETIVGRSTNPLPTLRTILPERTGGPTPAAAEPGDLPPLPPPEKRAEAAEARARHEGATVLARESSWRAAVDGAGSNKLTLEEGCHRIEVFAVDPRTDKPSRTGRLDLDAELYDEDDRLIVRDRTDAPDARLTTCVGESTNVTANFGGAPPSSALEVTHAFWPIPKNLPVVWGTEVRARMTEVLLARHVAPPPLPAVALMQGGAGQTPLTVLLEPGACYLAVVSVVQGTARGVGLRAVVGARDVSDDRGSSDHAGAVAFCAEDRDRAQIEIDARGTSIGWGLALFRVQGGIWEGGR